MIAIFKTGGKQYSAKIGEILKVEKIVGKKGDNLILNNVLAIIDGTNSSIGHPMLKDASVKVKILEQIRDKKILVFKKRKRQNSRSTKGHRQYLTVVKIESINKDSKSGAAKKTDIDLVKTQNIKKSTTNTKKISNSIKKKQSKKEVSGIKSPKKKKTTKKTVVKKSTIK